MLWVNIPSSLLSYLLMGAYVSGVARATHDDEDSMMYGAFWPITLLVASFCRIVVPVYRLGFRVESKRLQAIKERSMELLRVNAEVEKASQELEAIMAQEDILNRLECAKRS
jgi:hypothetical protein